MKDQQTLMLANKLRRAIARHSTPVCHLCGLPMEKPLGETIWCHHCLAFFSPQPRCQQCGIETVAPTSKCGDCLSEPPLWDRLFCVGDYHLPLSSYVHKLKYSASPQYAFDLSYLLSQRISEPAPLIVSVPLHWRRQLQRGYNQSEYLGACLRYHLGVQSLFDAKLFRRTKATPPQQGLNKQQREKNLRHAFTLRFFPVQTHVAIVDDVVTTGSTVKQLSRLLRNAGVEKIDIYCICRTER